MKAIQATQFDFDLDLKPHYDSLSRKYDGVFEVVNPLYVFKKIRTEADNIAIASLIIPVGALVFIGNSSSGARKRVSIGHSGKMRASEAYVHSIYRKGFDHWSFLEQRWIEMQAKQLKHGRSGYLSSFKYHVGKTVRPRCEFSKAPYECGSGIHFFLTAKQALAY